ncbi:hypothetical protein [Tranquillimonas rosea]|uniref:hypothetical protein n=1 Tax=Tranquillimonas rosea TaxID=641238 RepID=UPI003BA987FD
MLFVLLLNAAPASAQCGGSVNGDDFERMTASTGGVADVFWPDGVFPLGHPMDVKIEDAPSANEKLRYYAWARIVDGTTDDPVPLDVTAVSTDLQTTTTNVRLEVNLGKEQTPWLIARTVFLLVACATDAGGGDPPAAFASLERSVSVALLGYLVAGAVLIAVVLVSVVGAQVIGRNRPKSQNEQRWGLKGLFVDHRDKMSLSLFQVAIFSVMILLAVAYVFGRTRELSDLSEDVLFLLGISAAGAIGGRVGDVQKNRLDWENWAWLKFTVGAFPQNELAQRPMWSQLVSRNGRFDLYRFQALAFTLLIAPAFAIMSLYSLGDANIPHGILAVLGLSQVTYLFGKIAEPPTISDFNNRITTMREAASDPNAAIADQDWERFKKEFTAAMGVCWNPSATQPRP